MNRAEFCLRDSTAPPEIFFCLRCGRTLTLTAAQQRGPVHLICRKPHNTTLTAWSGKESDVPQDGWLPCIHRGAETLRVILCGLCGARDLPVEVRACSIEGECTPRRTKPKAGEAKIVSCLSCPKREA